MTLISVIDRCRRQVLFSLSPWSCHLCGSALEDSVDLSTGICKNCRSAMLHMEWPMCAVCGLSLSSESHTCLSCRAFGSVFPGIGRMRSCFVYQGIVQTAMTLFKSGKAKSLRHYWAQEIEQLLPEVWEEGWLIVGAPSSRKNILRRGYDQVAVILTTFSRFYRSRVRTHGLNRDQGISQKTLNREERATNLTGKIRVSAQLKSELSIAKGVVLVDDVCTTGATLASCATALIHAGAAAVRAITICRD